MRAEKLARILAAYGLGAARAVPLESADNHVFRVETAGRRRFMLRVSHGFDPIEAVRDHVGVELAWLEHILSAGSLAVPRPVRLADPAGASHGTADVDGRRRVFVLFEWIEGEGAGSPDRLHARSVRRMGRALARLHESSRAFAPPAGLCAVRWDEADFFAWVEEGRAEADLGARRFGVVRDALGRARAVTAELDRGARHYGLIHSDAHPSNMIVCGDEIAIIDFADCGWGHYAFDLGVLLNELGIGAPARPGLLEAALDGYREVAPLPVTDPAQLAGFVALRSIASLHWIARSPDADERRAALRSRPAVPSFVTQLERFAEGRNPW